MQPSSPRGRRSSRYLERIAAARSATLNAYISVRARRRSREAGALERERESAGPLCGVPLAVKDVIDVAGVPTTAASRILADARRRPRTRRASSGCARRERSCSESSTPTSSPTGRRPRARTSARRGTLGDRSDLRRLERRLAALLRPPSSRPARSGPTRRARSGSRPASAASPGSGRRRAGSRTGAWSRSAWTFDTVGPIARSAEDCALLLEAVAGHDPRRSVHDRGRPVPPYASRLGGGVAGLRIGVVDRPLRAGHRPADRRRRARGRSTSSRRQGRRLSTSSCRFSTSSGRSSRRCSSPRRRRRTSPWLRTRLPDYGEDVRARLLTGLFLPPTSTSLGQRARRLAYESFQRCVRRRRPARRADDAGAAAARSARTRSRSAGRGWPTGWR